MSKKIDELRNLRADEIDTGKSITAKAKEENRDLSDEELEQVNAHVARSKELAEQIQAEEAKENARFAALAALDGEDEDASKPDPVTLRPNIGSTRSNERGGSIRAIRGEDTGKFAHFGEFLFKVRDAAVQPGFTDRRLGPEAAAPGMRTTVDSSGGFVIPDQFATTILERMYNTGELLSRVKAAGNYMSLQGSTIKIPRVAESTRADGSRAGGVRGYWVEEAGSHIDTYPRLGQMTLTLHKAGALGYITEEMLDDAPASGAFLQRCLTNELIFTVEDSIVNGTGHGKPLGINVANCVVSASAETNQTADTIWGPNIVSMWSRLWAPCRKTCVWLTSQSAEQFLWSLTLEGRYGSASTSAEGIPLYYPAGSLLNQGNYGMLMGRPVIPVEYCPKVGDAGDLILWDPASYMLVDKAGGPQSASSIHVQFLTEQTTFRVSYRVDGQPTWEQALTPYNAGATLSCIVNLTARA